MKLSELYKKQKPGLSFEIFPPKRDSFLSDIEPTLEIMADLKPDYIGITFGAGGSVANNKTIEIARLIKEKYHVEPMVHMTCLNYNKKDIDEYASMMVDTHSLRGKLSCRPTPSNYHLPRGRYRCNCCHRKRGGCGASPFLAALDCCRQRQLHS